jgi:hypothetical protein
MSTVERTEGPAAPGGFPTWSGTAHGKAVHWIGFDGKRADELEAQIQKSSRLQQLLLRNAYTLEGLAESERCELIQLIYAAPTVAEPCGCGQPSLGDTRLCRDHARRAFYTRT